MGSSRAGARGIEGSGFFQDTAEDAEKVTGGSQLLGALLLSTSVGLAALLQERWDFCTQASTGGCSEMSSAGQCPPRLGTSLPSSHLPPRAAGSGQGAQRPSHTLLWLHAEPSCLSLALIPFSAHFSQCWTSEGTKSRKEGLKAH